MKNRIVWGLLGIFIVALLLSIGATFAHAQSTGPITTPQLNTVIFPGQVSGFYPTIQTAVTKGCTLAGASIVISPGSPATGTSGWTISAVTGGCTKASILDQRVTPAQPYTWNGSAYTATTGSSGTVGTGTTGQIAQYPANGTAVQGATVSGDATIAAGGAVSVNKINGVAVTGTPAVGWVPTATSGVAATWQAPTGGGGISALTGDVTASGTGSVAATLATVNASPGSYALAHVTVNGKGLGTTVTAGTAADITNTLGYTPYQTPTLTGDLATGVLADYNFSQGSGTVLADVSGANACSGSPCNGTLGTGSNAPTWLDNALQFTFGQDQNVSLPATLNTGKTFAIAFYYAPVTSAPSGPPVNGAFTPLINSSIGSSGINLIFYPPFTPGGFGEPAIWNGSLATSSLNFSTGFHTYVYVLGTGGANVDHIYIDGTEVPYSVQGSTAGAQTSGNLFFGDCSCGPWIGQGGQFTAYRMRVFSTQLTASDASQLTQIFRSDVATRGVATSPFALSIGHPIAQFIGDSLTFGENVTTPYPSLLTLTNQPPYQINNWGIGGVELQTLTASEPNRVALQCEPTVGGPAIAVVWAGTNDFSQGVSVTKTFQNLTSEVATLKRAGCIVFVSTMIDRTTPNLATQKNSYNAMIRTGIVAAGAAAIVDIAASPLLGADGASANATYFGGGGGVHWNNTGEAIGVNEVNSAINYYFGANAANPTIITSSTYTMVAADGYVNFQPTANVTVTLPDCLGQTGAIYRLNMMAAFTLTVKNANSTEPINGTDYSSTGLAALAGAGTVSYTDVANPSAAAGCHWDSVPLTPTGGAAGGDLSGTYPNPTVAKVNGAAIPASAVAVGTNSSRQITAASLSGAGTSLLTFTGATPAGNLIGSNSGGTAIDSGISPGTLVLLTANNVYTGTNQYLNSTSLANLTAATSGANHNSPQNSTIGTYWNGSSSTQCAVNGQLSFAAGTNPATTYSLTQSGCAGPVLYQTPTLGTVTNCSSAASPAVCGSAPAGSVLIPVGTVSSTLTVNTTAVTANSQIFFYPDDTLGTKLGVTCNSTLATLIGGSAITSRTAGTSFTITFNGTIATNGVCGSYTIIN